MAGEAVVAACAGRAALRVVNSGRVRVPAVFENSFYVEDDGGNLACFLRDGAERGPLNILCRGWRNPAACGVREGDVLERSGSRLVSAGAVWELASCVAWAPDIHPPVDLSLLRGGYENFTAAIRYCAPVHSLALRFLEKASVGDSSDPMAAALFERVRDGIDALVRWLDDSVEGNEDAAFGLIGLGPGLTPSGDDIVAGMALALRFCGRAGAADRLRDAVGRLPEELTNRISWAHLRAAVEGEAAEVFLDVVDDILAGGEKLPNIVSRLSGVGHSSGWDAALGILTGLRHCIS